MIDEAVAAGARQDRACRELGIDPRTVQRWRCRDIGDDRRAGPNTVPKNKLTAAERRKTIEVLNGPEFRDLPPSQVVPRLADQGRYVASESTMYRILREEKLDKHRSQARPRRHRPTEHSATAPNRLWSWDITYLRSPVRGSFYRLYMVLDVFSRKIVGAVVHEVETSELAAALVKDAVAAERLHGMPSVLHSDNGSPMKGATLLATLQELGITPSFSRPRVSDDNPYSEALFRTAKYRPDYPSMPFKSLEAAREWVERFVRWYNNEHRHSAIGFVTPEERHQGLDQQVLAKRRKLYERTRRQLPHRWSGRTRAWGRPSIVRLNPDASSKEDSK